VLTQPINYCNHTLTCQVTHQFIRSICVVCSCQRTITRLIYKMQPHRSNLTIKQFYQLVNWKLLE